MGAGFLLGYTVCSKQTCLYRERKRPQNVGLGKEKWDFLLILSLHLKLL